MDIQEAVKGFSVQYKQSGQKEAEYWLKEHLVHVMVDAGALEGNNGLKVSEKTREWLSQFREAGKHDWLTNFGLFRFQNLPPKVKSDKILLANSVR